MEFMSDIGSGADIYRPSLFELVAQEKLRDLIQPAVKYILSVYAQRYPRYLLRLFNQFDEFYALVTLLVEKHYLKNYYASFAESFYGLKRIRSIRTKINLPEAAPDADLQKLKNSDIWLSLCFLVGIPYIKTKLDNKYEEISGGVGARLLGVTFSRENNEGNIQQLNRRERIRRFIRRFFKIFYPWLNAFYHGSNLLYNILYLYDKTCYYTPWLRLMGIEIRRMTAQDYREQSERRKNLPRNKLQSTTLLQISRYFSSLILSDLLDFLKILLPMSIFFYRFLEWWYSSEYARQPGRVDGIDVPPPEIIAPDPRGIPLPDTPNVCPICSNLLTNPTALSSGYVFCYLCISRHIEDYGRCPITLIKVEIDELRKIENSKMNTISEKEKEIDIVSQPFDNEQVRISSPNNLSEEILSEKTQDKVSEAETESSTKTNTSSNLRRSTRARKPPSWLLQDDTLITRRKSRRIDNKGEGDDDKKHVSDVDTINDTNKSTQNVKRKRGRPKKSSITNSSEDNTPDEIINESPASEVIIVREEPVVTAKNSSEQLNSEDFDKNVSDGLVNDSNESVPNIQKKRGRKMKNSSIQYSEKNSSENGTDESNTTEPKIRRKRGRSKKGSSSQSSDGHEKNRPEEMANESNGSVPEVRKKRGRPRKNSSEESSNDQDKNVVEEEIPRRRRGRPKKDSSTKSSEILDRNSSDDSINNTESNNSEPEIRKKRGRPKKSSTAQLDTVKPTTETRRAKKTKTRQTTQQGTPGSTSENSPENINKIASGDDLAPQPLVSIEQSSSRNSRNLLEDSGMSLYQAVLMLDSDLENTVSDWVETYEVDNQKALLILINFIIRSCGCPKTIEQEAIEDEDAI
ncbi:14783_t:CDS:10, partial [Funneliformis caledonium]